MIKVQHRDILRWIKLCLLGALLGFTLAGCNQYGYGTSYMPYGYSPNGMSPYGYGSGYSGYGSSYGMGSGGAMSFAALQQQVLMPYCMSCHPTAGTGAGGFGVETWQDVMAPRNYGGQQNFIVPGYPAQSQLYQIVEGGQMPPPSSAPQNPGLYQQLAGMIGQWIAAGTPQQ